MKNNLKNEKYGNLTVIGDSGERSKRGNIKWACQCICGNVILLKATDLRNKVDLSCGCSNPKFKEYFDKTKKLFEDNNCICLEKTYKSAKTKWKYVCSCGNKSEIYPDDFKKGRRCLECGIKSRRNKTIEKIKSIFSSSENTLIDVYYYKQRCRVTYICKNGHRVDQDSTSFKNGATCNKCASKNRGKEQKHDIKDIKKELEGLGLKYIDGYENTDLPFTYKCSCGNIAKGYLSAIRKGIRCGCGYKKGGENPKWNHNLTKEERLLKRSYPEYREWVKTVFTRDNYICQACWGFGNKLHAHHLEPYSINKEKRLDLNNGVTLCKDCHREFHSIYGINTCNTDDYYDYLNFTKEKRFW